jgi:hypothetical protein
MVDDDAYVELAKCCARACHVLKTATGGNSADSLSGPSRKRIEGLGRCVDPVNPSLLTITSGIRTVRHLESIVTAHANCARNLRKDHPGPTKECLFGWREILRFFDVRGCQLTMLMVPELPQGYLELDNALAASENERCEQGPTKAKLSKSAPNGHNLPPPAEPPLVLLLCLIRSAVPQGERASLIEAIFSSRKVSDMVRRLRGSDAQTFIDVVDEVRYRSPFLGKWPIDFVPTLLYPDRHWKAPTSRQGSEGNISSRYTKHALATPCFLDHCRSSYAKIRQGVRYTGVDLGMCGSASMKGGRSRSRC